MSSPIKSPEGNWWAVGTARLERTWIRISIVWCLVLFASMIVWGMAGNQNQTGPTYRVSTAEFMQKVRDYKEAGTQTEDGLVPADEHVYIGAARFAFDGFPVVLEAGKQYQVHMSSYDVQHGFSVRPEHALSKQMSLQLLPGYEWVLPMKFDEPGVYHVVCNEFCGLGHRAMHGSFIVRR